MASRVDLLPQSGNALEGNACVESDDGRRKLLGDFIDNHKENNISDDKLNLDKLVSEKTVVGERPMMIEKTKNQIKKEKKKASKTRKKLALSKQQQQPEEERPSSSCSSLRKRTKNQKRKQQRKAKKRAQALVDKEKKEDALTESSKPIPYGSSHGRGCQCSMLLEKDYYSLPHNKRRRLRMIWDRVLEDDLHVRADQIRVTPNFRKMAELFTSSGEDSGSDSDSDSGSDEDSDEDYY